MEPCEDKVSVKQGCQLSSTYFCATAATMTYYDLLRWTRKLKPEVNIISLKNHLGTQQIFLKSQHGMIKKSGRSAEPFTKSTDASTESSDKSNVRAIQ